MNISDPVIQQEVVSIDLKNGINQNEEPTSVDWTKYFTRVDNVDFDKVGVLAKRQGTSFLAGPGGVAESYRLLDLPDGVGLIGRLGGINHLLESGSTLVTKIEASKFKVDIRTIASTRSAVAAGSTAPSTISGYCQTDLYNVVVYVTPSKTGGVTSLFEIIVCDRYSNNIIRRWLYTSFASAPTLRLVCVDGRYLHFYETEAGGALVAGKFFQIDVGGVLPFSSGAISPTLVTLAGVDVIADAVAISGASVMLSIVGRLQKFNTAGTSVLTGTVAGFSIPNPASGIATDGSNFYVVGRTGANQVLLTVNSAFTTTRTATTTLVSGSDSRVAVNPATGFCLVLVYSTVTSTSSQTYPRINVHGAASGDTVLSTPGVIRGWVEASLPFWSTIDSQFYCALSSVMLANNGASPSNDTIANACVLVQITPSTVPTDRRPAAVLGGYNVTVGTNAPNGTMSSPFYPHKATINTLESALYVCTAAINSTGSVAIDLNKLSYFRPDGVSSTNAIIGGGFVSYYDGDRPTEQGWLSGASCFVSDTGAGSGIPAGTRSYMIVYEYKHLDGSSRFSRTSRPSNITLGTARDVLLEAIPPDVSKDDIQTGQQKHVMNIYRTTAGGIEFYLVFSGNFNGSGQIYQYTDTMSDTALLSQPRLFRQPLISGTAKDRYHALSTPCVVKHKDRVWFCNRSEVYFSSFDVDGEQTWFNPEFKIPIPEGQGPIVGLASLNGSLVVFKQSDIFVIDGDGPPENGGSGLEFSPPRRLQTEFGCIDQRSIIQVPDAVMFRSSRGFEMLSRNFSVSFAGENISNTASQYPYTGGCTIDRQHGNIIFVVGASQGTDVGAEAILQDTKLLVYNISAGAWSVWDTGYDVQDVLFTGVTIGGVEAQRLVLLQSGKDTLTYANSSTFQDTVPAGTTYQSMAIETGSIRANSIQDRILCSQLLLLVKNKTNHDLHISAAYDGSESFGDEQVFEADYWVGQEIRQIIYQVVRTDVQSIRFRITETAPSDPLTYPVGTGEGPQILDLAVKLGKVGGGAQLGWESTINNEV